MLILQKECRHTAGWRRHNQEGAVELGRCGSMVIKKIITSANADAFIKQQTAESQRGILGLTFNYQKPAKRSNSTLSLLCQNSHRLAGRSNLAEKWYLAVYGNKEWKKRASRHVCVCACVFLHMWHSNGPSDCMGEEWAYKCDCMHGDSDRWLTSGLIKGFTKIMTER